MRVSTVICLAIIFGIVAGVIYVLRARRFR